MTIFFSMSMTSKCIMNFNQKGMILSHVGSEHKNLFYLDAQHIFKINFDAKSSHSNEEVFFSLLIPI